MTNSFLKRLRTIGDGVMGGNFRDAAGRTGTWKFGGACRIGCKWQRCCWYGCRPL